MCLQSIIQPFSLLPVGGMGKGCFYLMVLTSVHWLLVNYFQVTEGLIKCIHLFKKLLNKILFDTKLSQRHI